MGLEPWPKSPWGLHFFSSGNWTLSFVEFSKESVEFSKPIALLPTLRSVKDTTPTNTTDNYKKIDESDFFLHVDF